MNDLMVWMKLLAGEVAFVIFIMLFVSWLRAAAAKRRDKKAVAKLIAKVKKEKSAREGILAGFLEQKMNLSGAALSKQTKLLMREELRLIQHFADVYKRRDSTAAVQFNLCVEAALAPYHLFSGTGAITETALSEENTDTDELERLRSENVRLSDELTVTMETMSRMLNEYSTMFSEATPDDTEEPDDTVDDRNMAQLDESELDISEEAVDSAEALAPPLNTVFPDEDDVLGEEDVDALFDNAEVEDSDDDKIEL